MAGVIDPLRSVTKTSLVPPRPRDQGDFARPDDPAGAATSGTNPLARPDPTQPVVVGPVPDGSNPLARPGDGTFTEPPPGSVVGGDAQAASAPATPATPAAGAGSKSPLAWDPTTGIVDQIRGITPQDVDAVGYQSGGIADTQGATSTGYDATGYTAQQGKAVTSDTNLSSALDSVLGKDSAIIQRARAGAAQSANARGLLNSSMAVQGGEAAAIDAALPIAQGDVQNAQFNAEQQNVMTINNVQQANAAEAFHAQATNEAAQFAAAAKNSASQFNSAEAQQKAIAASQLWDQAAAFSAQAKNAAASQNAQAYNDAMQRYVDAKNAAIAAQNDAENLARRDTAQIAAQKEIAQIGADATVTAAGIHAGATVQAAKIGAEAQERMQKAGLAQNQQQFTASLGQNAFNNFQAGLQNIELSDLEPDARQNALHNYMSVWSTNTDLPFTIDTSQFPAASSGPPPGP